MLDQVLTVLYTNLSYAEISLYGGNPKESASILISILEDRKQEISNDKAQIDKLLLELGSAFRATASKEKSPDVGSRNLE